MHGIFTLRGKSAAERAEEAEEEDDDEGGVGSGGGGGGGGEGGQDGFEVIVCSQLPVDDALGMLKDSLPLWQMQAVMARPSSVRLLYSHYKVEFELEVGGTLSWGTLDDKYSLSFVFKVRCACGIPRRAALMRL